VAGSEAIYSRYAVGWKRPLSGQSRQKIVVDIMTGMAYYAVIQDGHISAGETPWLS